MMRSVLAAVTFSFVFGSMPAFTQPYRFDCPTACLHHCARKELVPGLYRGNCQIACQRNCYRTRADRAAGTGH